MASENKKKKPKTVSFAMVRKQIKTLNANASGTILKLIERKTKL